MPALPPTTTLADWPEVVGTATTFVTALLAHELSRFGFKLAFWLSPSNRSRFRAGPPLVIATRQVTMAVMDCRTADAGPSWPAPTLFRNGGKKFVATLYLPQKDPGRRFPFLQAPPQS